MLSKWRVSMASAALVAGGVAAATGTATSGTALAATAAHFGPAARTAHLPAGPYVHPDASSSPWSGYVATGSTYKTVTASWVEPTVKCSGGNTHAAAWTGLDGYGTQTVEQTGSDFGCNGGKASYGAWYEMYPAAPIYYSVTVKAGDKMTATVTYSGGSYALVLSDATQGWTKTTTKSSSADKRASAEAIIEADPGEVPDFGTTNFSSVDVDGAGIGSTHHVKVILRANNGSAEDKVSALTGGDAFSITWLKV